MNKTRNTVSCLFLFISESISVLFALFSNEKKKDENLGGGEGSNYDKKWKFGGRGRK